MPLKKGKSQATISRNIAEMHKGPRYQKAMRKHGKKTADKMAVAAAMRTADMPMKPRLEKAGHTEHVMHIQ